MPLVIAPLNKILCVIKILTDEKTKKHLFDLGITVNSKIEVIKNNKNIICKVMDCRLALDMDLATKIIVA